MLGFKAFWSAAVTLAGIEIMRMIRKGQLRAAGKFRPAQQLYFAGKLNKSIFLDPTRPFRKFCDRTRRCTQSSVDGVYRDAPSGDAFARPAS